ncbi:hypothetical protein ACFXGA_06260 [Actinosynnema sp. NPDC059335]|uniref:hypothetical protein n=1 Tax=Actinosynnema sp. NPDC059335 TaxID=3346804 RepID=UPI0036710851
MPPRQRKDDETEQAGQADAKSGDTTTTSGQTESNPTAEPNTGGAPQIEPDAETTDTVADAPDTTNVTAHADRSETLEERSERWNPETHGTPPADRPQRGDY